MARETLELSVTRQAERQHVLERRKAAARTPGEREELAVLRRNEACLKSLRGFDEAAEAEDERGRRRLWVEYRRGGTASEGRGRHHVIGGYAQHGGAGGKCCGLRRTGGPSPELWGVFIIAVHRAFVLGLGAQHRGIVKSCQRVVRCV